MWRLRIENELLDSKSAIFFTGTFSDEAIENIKKRNSKKHSRSAKSNGRIKPSNDRNRNKKRNKRCNNRNYDKTMNDWHKPALDGIGYQDSLNGERAWWTDYIDKENILNKTATGLS